MPDELQNLLEKCQGENGKLFLAEAIEAFEGGRFRQCVISTWIGVVFDIIDKIAELAALGQSVAIRFIDEVETIRLSGDVAQSLEFERSILNRATKDFQLLTPLQAGRLDELKNERNRCAHPTMDSLSSPYSPTSHDALALMTRAVEHLLSQPPVYGKAAFDEVMAVIASDHFPTSVGDAKARLAQGPLQRPNAALFRNVFIVLTKNLMLEKYTPKEKRRRATALQALRALNPEEFHKNATVEIPALFKRVRDEHLSDTILTIATLPDLAAYLSEPDIVYLQKFIEFGKADATEDLLEFSARIPQLVDATSVALSKLNDQDLRSKFETTARELVLSAALAKLSRAKHFAEANKTTRIVLIPLATELHESQADEFLRIFAENDQVRGSTEAQKLVSRLIDLEEKRLEAAPEFWAEFGEELSRNYPGTTEKAFINRIENDLMVRW